MDPAPSVPGALIPLSLSLVTMADLDVERFFTRLGKLQSHFIKHK
jgi:hypothetical protein